MVNLQVELNKRVTELERALGENPQLRGMLPICAYCKSIRNDGDYWEGIETYISEHTEANAWRGVYWEQLAYLGQTDLSADQLEEFSNISLPLIGLPSDCGQGRVR